MGINKRTLLWTIVMATVLLGGTAHAATLIGDGGDNNISGTRAADTINGKGGDDSLHGRGGADVVTGGTGDDFIESFDRDNRTDKLYGGAGNDSFTVAKGDKAYGGPGNDDFNVVAGGRGTLVDCGPGRDIVSYLSAPRPTTRGCESVRLVPVG